mmetsp:Transcript_4256/g.10860  ORF Transcript_4256/g.10860 Transcript_4256/m.10860 type:complete len:316 (+) Transcript_4256:127-1074(+)
MSNDQSPGALGGTQRFSLAGGSGEGAEEAEAVVQSNDADAMMLAEFDLEVQAKVEHLRSVAESLAVTIENTFMVQMLKLPKKIRTLTMEEFCTKYAGDLQQVVDEQLRRVVDDLALEEDAAQALSAQRYNTMSRATAAKAANDDSGKFNTWNDATRKASAKKARSLRSAQKPPQPSGGASTPAVTGARTMRSLRSAVKGSPSAASHLPNFATPSAFGGPSVHNGLMPASSMKTPRAPALGEIAYSVNGSPIGATTVAKATVKRARSAATIELELEGGVTLDASALATLSEEAREEALDKLRELQLQVNTLMSQYV